MSFSSCCSDINAMPRWGTWTTGWRRRQRWRRSATRRRAPSPPSSALPLASHMSPVPAAEGAEEKLTLVSNVQPMFGSGFVLLKNMCTVLRTLHIVFVCVRDSFAVARIYQDDFEKVSIKPLGLNKSSETSILHSIGNLSFERRKQFLRKSFTKLLLRSLETWQDISIYGQQGKKTKNQLKWFMMNHYIYRRFLQKRNDNNSFVPVINSQSQTSLISFLHWAIWVEAQWSKNVSQNYDKY